MLQSMREKLNGVVAYVLVGLIIVIFALFGAEALFLGGLAPDSIADVNGRKVTELEVRRGVEMRKQQMRQMLGENADPRFLSDEFLLPTVRDGVIQQAVLITAAEASGLRVSTSDLDKTILEDDTFHRDGKFDADYYKSLLRQYAYTPASYRKELGDNRLLTQYQQTFMESAFITEQEVAQLARLQFETRSFRYITLPLNKTLATINVNNEEVAAYYEQHKDDFKTEAQAAVEYLLLEKQALAGSVTVSEEDIQAQYAAEVEEAGKKTERHAAHILIEEKADGSHNALLADLQKQLANGADFASLAKAHSADSGSAAQGGDVGVTTGSSFVAEFETALQQLKVGQVSAPVKTQFGYHIIKLLDQKAAPVPTLEQSRARIEQALKAEVVDEQYIEKVELLKEQAPKAASLAAVASELSSGGFAPKVQQTALFSRRDPLPLLMANPQLRDPGLLNEIFAEGVHAGTVTEVKELNDSAALVMRVTEYKPAVVQPLESVKAQAADKLRREKAGEQLNLHANELLQRLLAKESLEAIARSEQVSLQSQANRLRRDGDVAPEILRKAFAMAKPSGDALPADTLALGNGDWALIQLQEVTSPAPELLSAEQRNEVSEKLRNDARHGEFTSLLAMLTARADITRRKVAEPQP